MRNHKSEMHLQITSLESDNSYWKEQATLFEEDRTKLAKALKAEQQQHKADNTHYETELRAAQLNTDEEAFRLHGVNDRKIKSKVHSLSASRSLAKGSAAVEQRAGCY